MTTIIHASSFDDASERLEALQVSGASVPIIISRLSDEELLSRLSGVKYGIFDFDDTLTTGNQHKKIREKIEPKNASFDEAIIDWMMSEHKCFLSIRPEMIWFANMEKPELIEQGMFQAAFIAKNAADMVAAKMSRYSLQSIGRNLPVRDGAIDLLRHFTHCCIITYGHNEIVNAWLNQHEVGATVAGLWLHFNSTDQVVGFHPGTLVTGTNKGIIAKRFREQEGYATEPFLTVGDRPFDIETMFDNSQDANVLILPPAKAKARLAEFQTREFRNTWNRVSALLISDSFAPLIELLGAPHRG